MDSFTALKWGFVALAFLIVYVGSWARKERNRRWQAEEEVVRLRMLLRMADEREEDYTEELEKVSQLLAQREMQCHGTMASSPPKE